MKKNLYLNSILLIFYQILAIIIGLIIPRLIISEYGSSINGLVQSITQMLSIISLLDLGVGSVVQSKLYKPLYENNLKMVSEIYNVSRLFYKLIGKILIFYVIFLCIYYIFASSQDFEPFFYVSLIFSIAINFFFQYYLGLANMNLLGADQKYYIISLVNSCTIIVNFLITYYLVNSQTSIQIVMFFSSVIYIFRPILLSLYVKKNYKIEKTFKNNEVLKDKWNGFYQHISTILSNSAPIIVLTIFGNFKLISIYTVYNLPLNATRNIFDILSQTFKSHFGLLIASKSNKYLNLSFKKFELISHLLLVAIFATLSKSLMPFVILYTKNIKDIDYSYNTFSIIISLSCTLYILRLIYSTLVFSAGHFRQTQKYSVNEVILNFILAIILFKFYGISGIGYALCISILYRVISLVHYLSKQIITRPVFHFYKLLLVDLFSVGVLAFINSLFHYTNEKFIHFILLSILIFFIDIIFSCSIFLLFFYSDFKKLFYK